MGIAEEEPVRRAVRGWLRAGRTQAMAQASQSSFYSPTPRGWTWHGPVVPPSFSTFWVPAPMVSEQEEMQPHSSKSSIHLKNLFSCMSWGTLPAMGISLRRKIDGITRETRVMWWNWEGTVAGLGLAQQAWLSLIASWGRMFI